MTIHEAMHAFVGYWLGDNTARLQGRLTLNPLKHIDPFMTIILPIILAISGAPIFGGAKPVPFNPLNIKWGEWGAALIALAGPLTNFIIAFICYGIWVISGGGSGGIFQEIIITGIYVNLGFFIFNMIPIPPLDGSRVLYALAPEFVRRIMEAAEKYGIIMIFVLIVIFNNYIGVFISSIAGYILELFQNIYIH